MKQSKNNGGECALIKQRKLRYTLFRKDVDSDFKTDSFCVTNFIFLHLFTDLYTQVRKTTFTFSAICAYSGGRVSM